MGFDVSNQLSLRVAQPSDRVTLPGPMGAGMGLSVVLDFHKARYGPYPCRKQKIVVRLRQNSDHRSSENTPLL